MITSLEAKVTEYPADKAVKVTWSYALDGKPSELNSCSMRLGVGKNHKAVMWKQIVHVPLGKLKNGCVDETLGMDVLPTPKKGENIYCMFLFEGKYVYDERTKKAEMNHGREIGMSKIIALVSHESRVKRGV